MSLREHQTRVAEFIQENDLEAAPGFRLLDLISEIGEVIKDAVKSSDYGLEPGKMEVEEEEIGDALFSLLAVSERLGIDAEDALESALEKYERRMEEKGDPGSR